MWHLHSNIKGFIKLAEERLAEKRLVEKHLASLLTLQHCLHVSCYGDLHRVNPPIGAKEAAKLMAWAMGPDWQAANARALISNVVCGIRRGMAVASSGNQAKVGICCMKLVGFAYD